MEIVAAAAVAAVAPTIAALASWRDMRKRTNGAGPIGGELKEIRSEISDLRAEVRDVKADVREIRKGT